MPNTEPEQSTAAENNHTKLDSVIGGATMVESPLSDSSGKEITSEELKAMLGADSEATIGVLTDMTTIGMGGIGTVFSAHDPVLHREIAIKILRPAYRNQLNYVTSFIREARITAQIDHPNVMPVHKLGIYDDAGVYFTMKRIRGVTLANILRRLKDGDKELAETYTRQRLLEIFLAICNGAAFAHSKGIIHRDLKPSNIMVGDYGEVFIADWGIALYREENDNTPHAGKIHLGDLPDDSPKDPDGKNKISGTPAFMAPEQITGKDEELDEQLDVYALGAILYSILTWEQSPYEGVSTVSELVKHVVSRRFQRPRRRAPRRKIPFELEAITLKAMHHDKRKRYKSVLDLQNDVRNFIGKYPVSAYNPLWYRMLKMIQRHPLIPSTLLIVGLLFGLLQGAVWLQHGVEARSVILAVENQLNECDAARGKAIAARNKLNEMFVSSGRTETHGEALTLRSRYLTSYNEFTTSSDSAWDNLQRLQRLEVDEDKLALLYSRLLHNQLQLAIAINSKSLHEQIEVRLRQLPPQLQAKVLQKTPVVKKHMQLHKQTQGHLQINSKCKFTKLTAGKLESNGEVVKGSAIELKLNEPNALENGCYLINAQRANGKVMQFPVYIERNQSEVIELTDTGNIPDNLIYVPGGSFIFGERTFDEQFARANIKAFFIEKTEVTIAEYLKFWKSLKDADLRERYRAWVDEAPGKKRTLKPLWDENGNLLEPFKGNMPIIGVTSEAAEAYCRYKSSVSTLKYRLPTALEWEKAARGVDGRDYVWGSDYKPNMANINYDVLKPYGQLPQEVGANPGDRSIYGVYDMTGNVRELVTNPAEVPHYMVKGGSCNLSQRFARLAVNAYTADLSELGFRCVAEIPGK